jgi:uncharacterized protein (TIGR02996 family)
MTTSMSDEDGFWAAIAANPDDDLPKLVFADWLDERGDPRGQCLRWVVARGKRPGYVGLQPVRWVNTLVLNFPHHSDTVNPSLFGRLSGHKPSGYAYCYYPHVVCAYQDLCWAWRVCVEEGVAPT